MQFDNSKIKGIRTLVKFRINHDATRSRNRIITTTLGKFGFINATYRGECPNDEEFWIAEIDSVVIKNHPVSGIFILTPIYKVEQDGYDYITHGLYTYVDHQGIRLVCPKIQGGHWLMSLDDRRLLMAPEIHAIVVVNGINNVAESLMSDTQETGVSKPAGVTHE